MSNIRDPEEMVDVNVEEHQHGFGIDDDDEDELESVAESSVAPHDQLPTLEEARANLSHDAVESPAARKKKMCYVGIIVVFLGLITAVIVLATLGGGGSGGSDANNVPSERREFITKLLLRNDVSSKKDLEDADKPQGQALAFVVNSDTFDIDVEEDRHRIIERYVLAVLFYHFGGQAWIMGFNFLTPMNHCEWYSRFPIDQDTSAHLGVLCDETDAVVGINLSGNNLKGKDIPEEIVHLKSLRVLYAWKNEIAGRLPSSIHKLSKLESLVLMHNKLSGTIPESIGQLTKMTDLLLGNNLLTGNIPAEIANLSNLSFLTLDDNDKLSGNVDWLFGKMDKLKTLFLEDNNLSGTLDSIVTLPLLESLDVSNNLIEGIVPPELFTSNLYIADLHSNLIEGDFPEIDGQTINNNLAYFSIYGNSIKGTVPEEINGLKQLRHFDIAENKLNGTLPAAMNQLTTLAYLSTSGNKFEKQRLEDLQLGSLTDLFQLSMKGNRLFGTLPDWLGDLTKLELLDLDSNKLDGSIPALTVEKLQDMVYLLLNRNQLTGSLPTEIAGLMSLALLLVDGNNLTGDANAICSNLDISFFIADCNGTVAEIDCKCCTTCCDDSNKDCNNRAWTFNLDTIYENGSVDFEELFNLDEATGSYSKKAKDDDEPTPDP